MADFSEARRHCWTGGRAQKFSQTNRSSPGKLGFAAAAAARRHRRLPLSSDEREKNCLREAGPTTRSLSLK